MNKILFFLINMNLGGTEKSFLNLLKSLPQDREIELLLLEDYGVLLNEVPSNVQITIIENHQIINEYIELGSRQFGFKQLKQGKLGLFVKSELQFVFDKMNWSKNPYWPIKSYIKPLTSTYNMAVAYAGVHDFIAYYLLEKTQARKKVLWIHFDIDKVIANFSFGTRYYHHFNQIFCVSDNATAVFKKAFPLTEKSVFTFNNIINRKTLLEQAELTDSFEDDFEGLRILTLGRLSHEKGQLMIPSTVKRLKEEGIDFRWYLIGDGKLLPVLQQTIKELNIEGHLVLLGRKMNPYPFIKDCDLYVQTSFHEGYCITLQEAKIFNKPVVTTNFLSASNLINHNENGLIVDISKDGLYLGVKTLLNDQALRCKFSTPATTDFSYVENIEKLLSL